MPRQARIDIAGEVYHVINRANARSSIFKTDGDFKAVLEAIEEISVKIPLEIFSFCIMPNHWHFAVRPMQDGDMGKFFGKLTQTITQRWHAFHHTTGLGHLFQGRFKTFLVQTDPYFIQLMKYIEANPLRAGLVKRAEDWKWGSLYARQTNSALAAKILSAWPVDMPANYLDDVNLPLPKNSLEGIRDSIVRGRPLGTEDWLNRTIGKYGLEYTMRSRGGQTKGT
jgi:putative transposase